MTRLLLYQLLVLSFLVSLFWEAGGAYEQQIDDTTAQNVENKCPIVNDLACEIREMKLKVDQLESTFEKAAQELNAKDLRIEKLEKSIEQMDEEIHRLGSLLSSLEATSDQKEKLKALEEKVKLLWDVSRKNQFDIHILEEKADEAEKQTETVASQVEQMANIVTELWIQIQQLEQALQITEIRRAKLQSQILSTKCIFVKLVRALTKGPRAKVGEFSDGNVSTKRSTWAIYLSECLSHLKGLLSSIKKYHHQLQAVVKREMQTYKLPSSISNEEVVFLVASALIVCPIMTAWVFLSSIWSC